MKQKIWNMFVYLMILVSAGLVVGLVDSASVNAVQEQAGDGSVLFAAQNGIGPNLASNGIGQDLNVQVRAGKEEIRSGEYAGAQGQLLQVRELAQNLKDLRVNGVSAQTELDVIAETDSSGKTKFKVMMNNGQEREIKIMPDTASEKALAALRLNVCSAENNCVIQLKDVGSRTTEKVQYEMQIERHSKLLGLFQKKMQVSADVDAETGVVKTHKPWWAFIAAEPAEN